MYKYSFMFFFVVLSIIGCGKQKTSLQDDGLSKLTDVQVEWGKKGKKYYLEQIDEAIKWSDTLEKVGFLSVEAKTVFSKVREYYKKAEPFAAYLNPDIAKKANGPALPIYKDDSGKVVQPVGLQKIEETIYGEEGSQDDFDRELYILKGVFKNLRNEILERKLTPERFFIATHQQLMRITSLSTVGFDTPSSGEGIKEIVISLNSLIEIYTLTISKLTIHKNITLDREFRKTVGDAIGFINNNTDFESFDRYTFLRDYMNPIVRNWVDIRRESNLWDGKTNAQIYNFDAPTFFEKDSFKVDYFLSINNKSPSKEKIDLGRKLFFDKNLSGTGNVSCATCHIPEKGYTDGLKLSIGNQGSRLKRNSPTLLNSLYQKNFFWDGRAGTITAQIRSVFDNKDEFATAIHRFSNKIIEKDSSYVDMFKKAYGEVPKSNRITIKAISTYLSTLQSFNSKFDKNIRGEEDTYTVSEKNGFNLFTGKALCATCHFIPLTNGTVPPFFAETEKEVIGVPETKANKKWDDDLGFYWVFESELHRGMFKTPTIRNAALTAPYMHNGVYDTLEEVMDFYNKGGGAGLGFDIPHQTLPFDNLNLTDQEIKDLVAFIETLSDNAIESENY